MRIEHQILIADDQPLGSVYLGIKPDLLELKKQQVVSRSSTEAEYRSLAHLVAEMTWIFLYLLS